MPAITFTPQTTIHKSVEIDATPGQVWQSLTTPTLIQAWMAEGTLEIFSAWQAGSSIIFKGDMHGLAYENKGTILQYIPGHIFEYTLLSSLSGFEDVPEHYSIIRFEISTKNGITNLTLTQRNFITEINYRHFNFYWNTALALIKKVSEEE
jgi:uncharacterized protein YndB with AHSA1/START domain